MADEIKHEKGAHYRKTFCCSGCGTPIQIDPYRVDRTNGPFPAPAFHIMKKIMRFDRKGHSEQTLVEEILCSAERWKQMMQEEGTWKDDV